MSIDLKTGGFKSIGEYVATVRKACLEGHKDGRLDEIQELWLKKRREKTAGHMEESVDSQGGHLVPEQWADGIYHAGLENAIVRPRATVFKATTDSLKVRRLVESDRSSSLFGGITFQWIEERASKYDIKSKPEIGEVELNVHKLVGSCFVSNELEDDYGEFGKFMETAFGQAIRFIEDDAFINGTGAGMPLGLMAPAPALITIARAQDGQVVYEDITGMVSRLLPASWESAVFLVNPDVMQQWLSLDALHAYIRNIINMEKRTILGFPFIVTEKCQSLNTSGDVILADFGHGHYLIADREMRISASREVNVSSMGWDTDETFWRVVLRTDGRPLMASSITPYKGANPLSAFVALEAHTS